MNIKKFFIYTGASILLLTSIKLGSNVNHAMVNANTLRQTKITNEFQPKKIKIGAHRGFSSLEVENSLAAILRATKDNNVDMVELDVQITKDNKLVVIHNDNVFWVSDTYGDVEDLTLEKLKKIKINHDELEDSYRYVTSLMDPLFGQIVRERIMENRLNKEPIATLDEILENVDSKKELLVEIKSVLEDYNNFNKIFLRIINNCDDNILIQGVNSSQLLQIKKDNPHLKVGILIKKEEDFNKLKLNFDFFNIDYRMILKDNFPVDLIKDKKIYIYTINNDDAYLGLEKCLDKLSTDDICVLTDYPDIFNPVLNSNFLQKELIY